MLDEEGKLSDRLNTGHVKTYDVPADQAEELKQLLEMHVKATGSAKAAGILADFGAWAGKFRAVISDEYLNWMKEMC